MIDEKKIEEAAKENSEKSCTPAFQESMEIGFKDGVNWLLDNLWHDASEEPKEVESLIVKLEDGEIHSAYRASKYIYITNVEDGCEISVGLNEVVRWLYIEDLQKGGK